MADPGKYQETWQSASYEPYKKDIEDMYLAGGALFAKSNAAMKLAAKNGLDQSITGRARQQANQAKRDASKQARKERRVTTKKTTTTTS
tara:strand:+ start:207 stop:473 length:267 start_codon:yes stop_codon:yes gene_type:complete